MVKRVKTLLHTAPKDQQMGRRERGKSHGIEAIGRRREEPIEGTLDDDGRRLHAVNRYAAGWPRSPSIGRRRSSCSAERAART